MAKLKDLVTNQDGRMSTTATIQLFGFICAMGVLLYSVYLNSEYVPEMFSTFLWCCVGGTAAKGAVNAVSAFAKKGGDQ